jgi:hydrogenase expression/formation protein HypE
MSKLENIHIGHGSGGELTRALLDTYIFKTFSNPYLDKKHDGAIVDLKGEIAISTDSFVITPIFFKGGNIGELAVNGTVNDVAMCGAIPQYLSLAFIIEEGLHLKDFETIVKSVDEAAKRSQVQIITGDTKVVEKGKGDKIFINTTGFGLKHPKAAIDVSRIQPGDKIIINGYLAQHGMAIMSEREGLEFETEIKSDTTNLNFIVRKLLDTFGSAIKLFRDPTRGGLATVLNEIAADTHLGVAISERAFPIEKQVAAACEMFGLDPLYVANEGVFVTIVDASVAEAVLALMRNDEKGAQAALIGEFTAAHPQKVVMESMIGGKRIVSPLVGEQLPRIC